MEKVSQSSHVYADGVVPHIKKLGKRECPVCRSVVHTCKFGEDKFIDVHRNPKNGKICFGSEMQLSYLE